MRHANVQPFAVAASISACVSLARLVEPIVRVAEVTVAQFVMISTRASRVNRVEAEMLKLAFIPVILISDRAEQPPNVLMKKFTWLASNAGTEVKA